MSECVCLSVCLSGAHIEDANVCVYASMCGDANVYVDVYVGEYVCITATREHVYITATR